ncbi:integrase arm-type DNA-binding domain-containing protein [Rhodanobacter sp. L36]|uniref:tyrosine-type recombinase/integrase n=1 Tax=Rhodanobacter sp. L36 TaxID=1747221 RepID=UPI00131C50B3|nr:integrase arm-type DNA-binding domain-containing protein [Rhodanobacter sp. L36]
MARQTKKLTALEVNRASTPGYLGDGGGLYLQISPSGSKSWVFRFQLDGKAREMGLGKYPDRTLEKARKKAEEARELLVDKIDPIADRDRKQQAKRVAEAHVMAFGVCCEKYIDAHRAGWRNDKHAAQWSATLVTYCAPIWKLDVAKIDTALVMECIEPIWTTKPETASRVRGRMESVLAWATVRKLRTGDNPAAWKNHLDQLLPKRSKVKAVEHRPALAYADMPEFMARLRARTGLAARALDLQILTATRPGEAAAAQWEEFDLGAAVWIIPGSRMKAGLEHRVPLSPAAVALLRSLSTQTTGNVFPGVRGRPLTTAAGMKLLKDLEPGITAHGFRSSFRDWAGETTSHPREIIESAMAHRLKNASEAAYSRGDQLARRAKLMNDWARYCAGKK